MSLLDYLAIPIGAASMALSRFAAAPAAERRTDAEEEHIPAGGSLDLTDLSSVTDEWILQNGYSAYRDVLKHVPEVTGAVKDFIEQAVRPAWHVTPFSEDKRDKEIADEIARTFRQLGAGSRDGKQVFQSFGQFLRQAGRRAFIDGLYIAEPVEYRDKATGRILLDHVKEKDPSMVWKFDQDKFGNLLQVIWDIDGTRIYSDPRDLLIWPRGQEFMNLRGQSELTSLYRACYNLKLVRKISHILCEKIVKGQPVAKMPHNMMRAHKNEVLDILRRMTVESAAVIPDFVELDVYKQGDKTGADFLNWFYRVNRDVVLYLITGQTLASFEAEHGTRAQAETHAESRSSRVLSFRRELAEFAQRQLVHRYVDLNWWSAAYPEFGFQEKSTPDIKRDRSLFDMGLPLSVKQLREEHGRVAPEDDDDELSAVKLAASGVDIRGPSGGDNPDIEKLITSGQMAEAKGMTPRHRAIKRTLDDLEANGMKTLTAVMMTERDRILALIGAKYATWRKNPATIDIGGKEFKAALGAAMTAYVDKVAVAGRKSAKDRVKELTAKRGKAPKGFAENVIHFSEWWDEEFFEGLKTLMARFYGDDLAEDTLREIARKIADQMAAGASLEQIQAGVSQVFDRLSIPTPKAFEDGYRLYKIVRTMTTQGFNYARMYEFRQVASIKGYRYDAILDDRTTEFCQTMNGRTWDANDPTAMQFIPPNHWHCRSLMDVVWYDEKDWRNPPPPSLKPPEGFGQLGMAA